MKSCLLVDDSKAIRAIVRPILANLGFEVLEAGDGAEALKICQAEFPTAVLLDWNMPVMNGVEFLRTLRSEPGGRTPVVVLCTVENDREHIAEALDAGADEYIMKPFDGDIIEAKFAQAGLRL
jgi:two-component system chemotaxis response regulator CheY